jgi:2-iminobutanoate/2-iminopropanoate deaminase
MAHWTPVYLSDDVPPPKGPYSPAVRAGDFVYVSGQTPRDPRTGDLIGNDVVTQTRQALSNVRHVLEQAGAAMSDVVSMTIYLQDMNDWATMNGVYAEFFARPYPSRTTVGAELRGILIEVSAVAYVRSRA